LTFIEPDIVYHLHSLIDYLLVVAVTRTVLVLVAFTVDVDFLMEVAVAVDVVTTVEV